MYNLIEKIEKQFQKIYLIYNVNDIKVLYINIVIYMYMRIIQLNKWEQHQLKLFSFINEKCDRQFSLYFAETSVKLKKQTLHDKLFWLASDPRGEQPNGTVRRDTMAP